MVGLFAPLVSISKSLPSQAASHTPGGNDLVLLKEQALVIQAHDTHHFTLQQWPGVFVIWSAVIP